MSGTGCVGLTAIECHGKVATFDAFTPDNDPYGERNFGAFNHNGQRIFGIDYYDTMLAGGSEDPTDPNRPCAFSLSCSLLNANHPPAPVFTDASFLLFTSGKFCNITGSGIKPAA